MNSKFPPFLQLETLRETQINTKTYIDGRLTDEMGAPFGDLTGIKQEMADELVRRYMVHDKLVEATTKLLKAVEDFMPNIGKCVLQDYANLNTSMMLGGAVLVQETEHLAALQNASSERSTT